MSNWIDFISVQFMGQEFMGGGRGEILCMCVFDQCQILLGIILGDKRHSCVVRHVIQDVLSQFTCVQQVIFILTNAFTCIIQ